MYDTFYNLGYQFMQLMSKVFNNLMFNNATFSPWVTCIILFAFIVIIYGFLFGLPIKVLSFITSFLRGD